MMTSYDRLTYHVKVFFDAEEEVGLLDGGDAGGELQGAGHCAALDGVGGLFQFGARGEGSGGRAARAAGRAGVAGGRQDEYSDQQQVLDSHKSHGYTSAGPIMPQKGCPSSENPSQPHEGSHRQESVQTASSQFAVLFLAIPLLFRTGNRAE